MNSVLKSIGIIILFSIWSCSSQSDNTVNSILGDLKEMQPGSDATPLVTALMYATESETEIILPAGRYVFWPDFAVERYCIMSNNDDGNHRIAFDLTGKKNLVIDGQGSELVFNGKIIPFNLEDAENITLRNFSIDWERTFHSEATVVAVDRVNQTFDISISEKFPYRIEGDELIFMEKSDVDEWSTDGWRQNIAYNLFFDPEIGGTSYGVRYHKMNPYHTLLHTQYEAEEIEKGLVRIYNRISELPEPGWIWVSRGRIEPHRQSPAIRIFGSKNITLENINIYHAGAMGIIGERSENINLENVNLLLPPDKGRIVSAVADATHFVNCRGHISINNSIFENMLDDATNIHGTYLKLVHHVNDHTIGAHAAHHQQNVARWAAPGDTIVFRDNRTMDAYKTIVIKELRYINKRYAEMTFHENVGDLRIDSGIENPSWYPTFSMTNSTVRNNRARSILLSSCREMLIENNKFIRPMMAAISIAGDMNFWFESGNVTSLTIRDNHFIDACTGGFDQAVIHFEPVILEPENAASPYHDNIIIESNVFETFDNRIMEVFSASNLVFRNNTIRQTGSFPRFFPDAPAINIIKSQNIDISGNIYEGEGAARVVTDDLSEISSESANNPGFDL